MSLKDSLEYECGALLKYLTNKSKIAFLTTTDLIQGKLIQKETDPVHVIEEYVDESNETGEELVGENAPSDSVEAELPEEAVDTEEDQERIDVEGLDC